MIRVVVALLLLAASPCVAQDPPGTQATPLPAPATGPRDPVKPKDSGTARVSGRVVASDSGVPLRRAEVTLGGESLKEGRSTSTDENGRYEFKDLPAGRFQLSAGKAGFGWVAFGQRRPFQPGRPIVLADGQAMTRVDFALPRGGVIAGRLTDEFGEPIANIGVRAMRYSWANGKRQLAPVGYAGTDDRGLFRLFGLAAGEYYVAAQPGERGFSMTQSDSRSGFATTYYPGTPSPGEAQRLRVTPGSEHGSVNFALIPARTVKVSGTVVTSTGDLATEGFIMMQAGGPDDMSFNMSGGALVQPDGSFTVSHVSPGEYVLHINLGRDEEGESGSLPIAVTGEEDLTGLTLTTRRPTRLTGQLVFDGAPPEHLRPAQFRFYLQPASPGGMMYGGPLQTKDDWTLQGRATNGPFLVNGDLPEGWMIKSVLVNGEDVIDTGIPSRSGDVVDGVQIVVTNRLTRVTGTAVDDLGQPAREYVAVIFPEDAGAWRTFSRRQRVESPDQQGRFEVKSLPPGHYLAVALDYIEDGQQMDPEFLESIRAYATPFDVGDGDTKALSLRMVRHP
jgi:hypothetical protein